MSAYFNVDIKATLIGQYNIKAWEKKLILDGDNLEAVDSI